MREIRYAQSIRLASTNKVLNNMELTTFLPWTVTGWEWPKENVKHRLRNSAGQKWFWKGFLWRGGEEGEKGKGGERERKKFQRVTTWLAYLWSFDQKLMSVEQISFDTCIMVVSHLMHVKGHSLWLSQSGICGHQQTKKWTKVGSYSGQPFPFAPHSGVPFPSHAR